jgi:prephenate dehydratase
MMKIAIQGERGSFSHAVAAHLAPKAKLAPCASSYEVFDRVVRGTVGAAVIPIENSLAGSVAEHFDLLLARPVFIQREYRWRISHALIVPPGVKFAQVKRVFSHPVALEQCRDFFRRHAAIQAIPFYDTAGSVQYIMREKLRDAAALAGPQAAKEYGARILRRGLEDDKQNFTRFFLIRKSAGARPLPKADKISIAFALKSLPGALFRALSVFALRDLDLSKIESRPMRGRPWEYVFYVDVLRGLDLDAMNALRHLAEVADFVKVLGIYPAA